MLTAQQSTGWQDDAFIPNILLVVKKKCLYIVETGGITSFREIGRDRERRVGLAGVPSASSGRFCAGL
jgi:hypothetical protein